MPIVGLESIPIITTSSPAETSAPSWPRRCGPSVGGAAAAPGCPPAAHHQNRRTRAERGFGTGHLPRRPAALKARGRTTGSQHEGAFAPPSVFAFSLAGSGRGTISRATVRPSKSEQHLPRACPAPASGGKAPRASSRRDTRSTRGTMRPDARSGKPPARRPGRRPPSPPRTRRSIVPIRRASFPSVPAATGRRRLRLPSPRSRSCPWRDHTRNRTRDSGRRRARSRRSHRRLSFARVTSCSGPITSAPRAATCARTDSERTVARTRPPATAPSWTAAVPTPPLAPLTTKLAETEVAERECTASCAVTKTSGTAAALTSSSPAGTGATCRSCDEHPVREAAATDDPEDAVADLEPGRRRTARDHRPAVLDARDVGGEPGGAG